MSSVLLASPASAPVTKAKSVERHSNHDEALSEDRYGDFVSSINESIFDHKGDKFYLYPRYGKSEHLAKTGLPELDERYTITRYIYATVHGYAPSEWFGFVAVSTPQQSEYLGCREIVVAIRGTISDAEWHQNLFKANMVTCDRIDPSKKARVHCGFYSIYSSTNEAHAFGELSLRNQIFKEVEELVSSGDNKKDVRIVCAGHSLGSSLATLAAADLSINFASGRSNVKVHLVAYASPKVGNAEFKHLVESQSTLVITRYSGVGDLVPHVPIYDAVENWIGVIPNLPITYYQHVGKEQKPDWTKSPYVQPWLLKEHNIFGGSLMAEPDGVSRHILEFATISNSTYTPLQHNPLSSSPCSSSRPNRSKPPRSKRRWRSLTRDTGRRAWKPWLHSTRIWRTWKRLQP
ncbi:phospholipase A1 EG1, chloroplastic/mitochondrial [Selaginella moellendorffii]|uniref:phospholipase A1 EG1, chloroplastic/mitochondrial n=1 Tax=Selaginella moellendorffii TaxID=88036 RepID=UPI000D1D08C4|nr:phospholipase A1 EG1, chloroplastic/mitochondrial [Selaginella moellendorffii]|eukprot:XP_024515371.1 phospholipase A1 EG1, chloroplastic/mitochondrial [Selaginella moellendorffii]